MNKLKLKIKTLENFRGELPQYQSAGASGFDVRAQLAGPVTLNPGERAMIPTGLSFETPIGFEIHSAIHAGWVGLNVKMA